MKLNPLRLVPRTEHSRGPILSPYNLLLQVEEKVASESPLQARYSSPKIRPSRLTLKFALMTLFAFIVTDSGFAVPLALPDQPVKS